MFGLRWLFTGFSQWFEKVKAFTDGPFKSGALCEASCDCAIKSENDVNKRSVTHEMNFFKNDRQGALNSVRPYLCSFIAIILFSFFKFCNLV